MTSGNYFWIHPNTEVIESIIHGFGRKALSTIRAGEAVCVAGGHAHLKKNVKWDTGLLIDEEFILQMPPHSNYEAFLNHSCDPNLYIDGQIVFRALREILSGEELTVDYGSFMVVQSVVIDKCGCGSDRCRKRITGEDYMSIDKPLSWYAQKLKNRNS